MLIRIFPDRLNSISRSSGSARLTPEGHRQLHGEVKKKRQQGKARGFGAPAKATQSYAPFGWDGCGLGSLGREIAGAQSTSLGAKAW